MPHSLCLRNRLFGSDDGDDTETTETPRGYEVLVRLRQGGAIKTVVFAEAQAWARLLANQIYGEQSVISVVEDIDGQKTPSSAEQIRIKSLNDQAKRYREMAQRTAAQNNLTKAKKRVSKLNFINSN